MELHTIGIDLSNSQFGLSSCSSKRKRRQLFGNFGNRPSAASPATCEAPNSRRKVIAASTIRTVTPEAMRVDVLM